MKPYTPVGVGVIGAGFISDQYLTNLTSYPDLRVIAVGDQFTERAAAQAAKYGVPVSGDPEAVLAHPDIEIIVNLTVPAAHVDIAKRAMAVGKHVWNEKPLATSLVESEALVAEAAERGLILGCAPDTFLGPGLQTVLRLLADGAIGSPRTANAIMQNPGPDRWHPDPEFIFQPGVGPLFDIGPYYLTALVQIFGAISNVSALSSSAQATRRVRVGPKTGEEFAVTVPTHTAALIEFAAGGQAQATFSYETELVREGFLEITGTEGTLVAPDPNHFDGTITIHRDGEAPRVIEVPAAATGRGAGVLDMARALRTGTPVRATGATADYVLVVMDAIARAAATREVVRLDRAIEPAPLLPEDWSATQATA